MPKIDLSITISVIVALAAIISPILTAIINNRHQKRMKLLELKQQQYENTLLHKRDIFESYLKGLGLVIHYSDHPNISTYSQYYLAAYMYLPDRVRSLMSEMNTKILYQNIDDVGNLYNLIATAIAEELQQL